MTVPTQSEAHGVLGALVALAAHVVAQGGHLQPQAAGPKVPSNRKDVLPVQSLQHSSK